MKRVLLPLLALGLCVCTPLARAASDYLLELDGIKGESKDRVHPETIEISSFSWGCSNPTSVGGGGAGTGKVQFQDFHFSAAVNKSSPLLMLACATGQHIKSAKLFVRKSGDAGEPVEYYVITLSDILVSSISQGGGGAGGGAVPTDQFSLNFTKITVEYQASDGTKTEGTAQRSELAGQ